MVNQFMFNSLMHIAFFTSNMDEMVEFYTKKLGLNVKYIVKYKEYLNCPNRKELYEEALRNPEKIFNVYIEIAQGQFIELFSSKENQKPHDSWNERLGYSHFALMVDDIYKTFKEFQEKEIPTKTIPTKGPSETWHFWSYDPDMNYFEIMQYTNKSYQIVGHCIEGE